MWDLIPHIFFERLTKEGIATVGESYRRVCKEYHKEYGSSSILFEKDVHSMNNISHCPTLNFNHNPYYLVNDPDVLDSLMTRDIGLINFDNNSPCPEFVKAWVG